MVYLAADHRGFALKEKIKEHLNKKGVPFEDMGAHVYDKDDDYPDFAVAAARKVAVDPNENRAIVLCGSGIGVSIAANKVHGAYAALVWNSRLAQGAREHDSANVIALPADYISEDEAYRAVDAFLETNSTTAERHARRFKKVQGIESNN